MPGNVANVEWQDDRADRAATREVLMTAAIHARSDPDAQFLVTAKQWCCLYDAANGKLVARARDAAEVWSTTEDGAIRHPGPVIDALVAAAMLRQVRHGRWSMTGRRVLRQALNAMRP